MKRTAFETITKRRVGVRIATPDDIAASEGGVNDGDVVLFNYNEPAEILASVNPDDLFDHHGNRFSFS